MIADVVVYYFHMYLWNKDQLIRSVSESLSDGLLCNFPAEISRETHGAEGFNLWRLA
jgi:hypothetical protein